jgi:hypothetical protein
MRTPARRRHGGAVLSAAVLALAVGAVLAAALADTVRSEVALAGLRSAGARALVAADTCAARIVAELPIGWDFGTTLRGADATAGSADDGLLPAAPGCTATARAAGGAPLPPRVLITVDARSGRGERALVAVVGYAATPGVPALLWLATAPPRGAIAGGLTLDGTDAGPEGDWAALAAPDDPAALDAWRADAGPRLEASPRTVPPLFSRPPPLAELAARVRTAGAAGREALHAAGPVEPALAHVDGDLTITDAVVGAGLLFVDGTLDIQGRLDFTGLVVAANGLSVASGGTLAVDGAIWLGAPPGSAPALAIAGTATVRQGRPGVEIADRLIGLPRRPRLLGLRDLG